MKTLICACVVGGFASVAAAQQTKAITATATATATIGKTVYENNFEKVEVCKLPEEVPPFMVLEGAFVVKAEGTNKFLELPGQPLDTFGALFGPTESSEVEVSARIHGTAQGRRFPTFGVG